ncbi:cell division protein ZapA [Porphyromonas sp.]
MAIDTDPEALQRITIAVNDARISLRVPRRDEHFYRKAGEELAHTMRLYREKYPNRSEVPIEGYLSMAAIDIATRYRQCMEALEERTQHLTPRLEVINDSLDALIADARRLIDTES